MCKRSRGREENNLSGKRRKEVYLRVKYCGPLKGTERGTQSRDKCFTDENTDEIKNNCNLIKVVNFIYLYSFFFNCEKGRMCQSTHLSDIHKICHSPEPPNHYLYPCPYIMPLWDKHIFVTGLLTGIHIMNSGFLKRDHL